MLWSVRMMTQSCLAISAGDASTEFSTLRPRRNVGTSGSLYERIAPLSLSSRMTSSAGDSRQSLTSFLYATPRIMILEQLNHFGAFGTADGNHPFNEL